MSSVPFPTTILGYPRIGPNREIKRALEPFWSGGPVSELQDVISAHRISTAQHLRDLGLSGSSAVPQDGAVIDHVLDLSALMGIVPIRFRDAGHSPAPVDSAEGLSLITALSRGTDAVEPLELTKWFDTNYHYYVPELEEAQSFSPDVETAVGRFTTLREATGITARPALVGPVTFLLLSKSVSEKTPQSSRLQFLNELVRAYSRIITALGEAGAQWIQLEEPALASDSWDIGRHEVIEAVEWAYGTLAQAEKRPEIFVPVGYGHAGSDALQALGSSGVEAIGIDLERGALPESEDFAPLAGRTVVAGVVGGLNIWRTDLEHTATILKELSQRHRGAVALGTSTSLIHVPHDASRETPPTGSPEDREVVAWLAFADQKIDEVQTLATFLREGRGLVADQFAEDAALRSRRREHPLVTVDAIRERLRTVRPEDRRRDPADLRRAVQEAELSLPELPTTTIGSFPQTSEIRRTRAAFRAGRITETDYVQATRNQIADCIRRQENLDLDVLVHGEAERNDMVQYFAENLEGFITTAHGWVQSYGSRCLRPPVLFGDVHRPEPITVDWINYAGSLTQKQVKGMLTGPVTILAWSFVRDDQPLSLTADQIALALREEVADLQRSGVQIIQVDEPALRELLPLRIAEQQTYLEWSVGAFRLATAGADTATQLHTHLCYSEFETVIDAIDALDADVTTVEASRSGFDVVSALEEHGYSRGIGPGIWDIHSPRVPSTEELAERLAHAARTLDPGRVWSNPDCGLKTRGWEETEASLRHLVAATQQVRTQLASR